MAQSDDYRRFLHGEFPAAVELDEGEEGGASRRSFLKLMGASLAMAGMTACRWPEEKIVPYANRPAGFDPGRTASFATAMEVAGVAVGMLATSFDGRPIKLEGNPQHPGSQGALSATMQAAVLGLYDPLRSRGPARRANEGLVNASWPEFSAFAGPHFAALEAAGGAGLAVLGEATSSPTWRRVRETFLARFPEARFYEYEAASRDNEREGMRLAFGRPLRAHHDLDKASVIVALEADFLADHPDSLRLARAFARGRRGDDGTMNRLYALESFHSLTGSQADHRFPMASGAVTIAAMRLARAIAGRTGDALGLASSLAAVADHPFAPAFLDTLVDELVAAAGRAVVIAGAQQPPIVHALAAAINAALGADASGVVSYTECDDGLRPAHALALEALVGAMKTGAVQTLVIVGGNPVYDAPGALNFASALAGVATTIHLSEHRDETSQRCTWHVPRTHFLESWSDARGYDGTISLVQPLIRPLYEGKTPAEFLAMLAGDTNARGYDLVRATHGLDEKSWRLALHDGVVAGSAPAPAPAVLDGSALAAAAAAFRTEWPSAERDALEVVFFPHPMLGDGRFANNHWLQEAPEPMTKLTWDNAALIGPSTARELGVWQGDVVTITIEGRSVEAPVYVMPGQAMHTIGVALGYGREVASEAVAGQGFNAQHLRPASGAWAVRGASVAKTGRTYALATTQNHFALDAMGREGIEQRRGDLVREVTLEDYKHDPKHAAGHKHKLYDLFSGHEYDGHRWAMAIDLSACIGCTACVVACQAENNVPVVGKERIQEGREMHWIRIDRYFAGPDDDPQVVTQPVTCMHCEDAPCEQVCPVAATVHDSEGLNVMVYNRCVGTRYCSNNCPYKVRRFNFFNYRRKLTDIEAMQLNPDVTVRSRGVMEKCTFCTQRIERARIDAKVANRPLKDGDIVTACEQTCPTNAIVFGDLNDETSRVRKLHDGYRAYPMLEYLNVKPRVEYLVKVRNPSSALAPQGSASDHKEHA